jgi:hypothetical protein
MGTIALLVTTLLLNSIAGQPAPIPPIMRSTSTRPTRRSRSFTRR